MGGVTGVGSFFSFRFLVFVAFFFQLATAFWRGNINCALLITSISSIPYVKHMMDGFLAKVTIV